MEDRGSRGRGSGSLNSRLNNTSSGNGGSNNLVQSALAMTAKRSSSTPPLFRTVTWILIVLCTSFLSFYVGVWTGIQATASSSSSVSEGTGSAANTRGTKLLSPSNLNLSDEEIERRVEMLAKQKVKAQLDDLCKKLPSAAATISKDNNCNCKDNIPPPASPGLQNKHNTTLCPRTGPCIQR